MFDKKPKDPAAPALLDRIVKSGAHKIAILGLHPQAGTRTVLASLVEEIGARSWPLALTSSPRLPLEQEEGAERLPVTKMRLPEGAWIATSAPSGPAEGQARLDLVESTPWSTTLGPVSIYRVVGAGEVDLHGPGESDSMKTVLKRLSELSGGMVLVDGAWERRAFAAPGVTDGVVIVFAAGYSATPERSAAAARYLVETLGAPPCDEAARDAWEETASKGAAALLDPRGRPYGVLPPGIDDPVPALKTPEGAPASAVVLPHGLNDEFMIPLVRSAMRCTLVVRDATRINVAPVYYKAWLKGRGRIQVVRPLRILAAVTNPWNPSGPDADPAAFREIVAGALPDLPVHDVVLESGGDRAKPAWKFWE
ncbi:MAG TPA: hypothetical protein VFV19_19035 [Candidatus Polarisedimenticolaceae bacterium]|nr:hypothetical protein [Candidatus Polarisedimenticolaceae bacterium]